jgi:hypothetical protein
VFGDNHAQGQQLRRFKRDGGAFAQIHHPFDRAFWSRKFACQSRDEIA